MREILFRGKFSEKSRWSYGDLYTDHGKVYIATRDTMHGVRVHEEVIPDTIGQYTGVTDKNGKKIFEGDIVQAKEPDTSYRFGCVWTLQVVVFREGSYGLLEFNKFFKSFRSFALSVTFEVVGNIHDNPEFLKGGEA